MLFTSVRAVHTDLSSRSFDKNRFLRSKIFRIRAVTFAAALIFSYCLKLTSVLQ